MSRVEIPSVILQGRGDERAMQCKRAFESGWTGLQGLKISA